MRSLDPAAPPCAASGHVPADEPLLHGVDRLAGVPGSWSVVVCRTCGMGGTVPRPDPSKLGDLYPDDYVIYQEPEQGTTLRERAGRLFDRARESTVMRLGALRPLTRRPPGRILDVGCGQGALLHWFGRHGWEMHGVEPSPQAAEVAGRGGAQIHLGTLDDHPFGHRTFDAVTFNHALEHVPDPLEALAEARRLLRPGGLLYVAVPNFGAWQRRAFGDRWFPLDLPRHLQHFTGTSLLTLAREAGLHPLGLRRSSTIVGLAGSLEYRLAGHRALSPPSFLRVAYATYPLVLLGDAVLGEPDCLHLIATR